MWVVFNVLSPEFKSRGTAKFFLTLVGFTQFFALAGFPCPALRNPSDHFLRCINSDFDKVKATLKGSMKLRVLHFLSTLYWASQSTAKRVFRFLVNSIFHHQFEASDDPLDKITTAEAIRTLINLYRTSQYCYSAREKVEEISKVVSVVVLKKLLKCLTNW